MHCIVLVYDIQGQSMTENLVEEQKKESPSGG